MTDCMNTRQVEILVRHLKHLDPSFTNIVFTAGKTVVYRFNQEWAELGIEGSLYLYRREGEPKHRLIVFNRSRPNDFKLGVPNKFYVEYQDKFVIFSHLEKENVFGFWIDDEAQAKALYEKFTKLIEK